jgi:peptidoglycan/LPS O-acetylase OafA/YrhL
VRARFPLVDSCRGIAAVSVLLFHVGLVGSLGRTGGWRPLEDGLWIGVPIFFVISGFLLYRPFAAARASGRQIDTGRYALGRALRIVPAYWAALTFFALTTGLPGVLTSDWWRYYGFLQVYDQDTLLGGMTVAWTLCVEVTFYIALPLYAVFARRLSRRAEYALLALLAIASFGIRAATIHGHWGNTLPASFMWFVPGMALALLSVDAPRLLAVVSRRSALCWLAGAALLVASCYAPLLGSNLLMLAAAPLIVLPALHTGDGGGAIRRVLSFKPLLWLGTVSYGIYLYHVTLMAWLVDHHGTDFGPSKWLSLAAVTLACTAVAAAVSWYVLEERALRLKSKSLRLPLRRRPVVERVPVAAERVAVPAER